MRPGVRCLERKFRDFAGLRIDPTEHIGQLACVPERDVAGCQWVMRPRPGRGRLPLVAARAAARRPRGPSPCHSLNETSAGPSITTPAGLPFSGKLLVK